MEVDDTEAAENPPTASETTRLPLRETKTNFAIEHGLDRHVLQLLRSELSSFSDVIRLTNTCKTVRNRFARSRADKKEWTELKPWFTMTYLRYRAPLSVHTFASKGLEDDVGCIDGWHVSHTFWLAQYSHNKEGAVTMDVDQNYISSWEVLNVAIIVVFMRENNEAKVLIIRPGDAVSIPWSNELTLRKKLRSVDPTHPSNEVCAVIRDQNGYDNRDIFLNEKLTKITKHENQETPGQVGLKFLFQRRCHDLSGKEVNVEQVVGFPSSLVAWRKIITNWRSIPLEGEEGEGDVKDKVFQQFFALTKSNTPISPKTKAGSPHSDGTSAWFQICDPRRVLCLSMHAAAPHNAPGGKRHCNRKGIITPGLDTAVSTIARNVTNFIYDVKHVIKDRQLFVIPFTAEGHMEWKGVSKSRCSPSGKERGESLDGTKKVCSARRRKRLNHLAKIIKLKSESKVEKSRTKTAADVRKYKVSSALRSGGYQDKGVYYNASPKRLTVNQVIDPFSSSSVLTKLRGEIVKGTVQDKANTRDKTPSVVQDKSPSVVQDRSPSVDQDRSPSVDQDRSPSVDQDRSPSVDQDRSPSVDQDRSPSVDQDWSPSVDQDRSPSMDQGRSPSVDQDRSPSMLQDKSPSMVKDRSPSVVAKKFKYDPSAVCHRHSCLIIGYTENDLALTFGILPCNLAKWDSSDDYLKCVNSEEMYGRLLRRIASGMNCWPCKWWRQMYNYVLHDKFRDTEIGGWHSSVSMAITFNIPPTRPTYIHMFKKLITHIKCTVRQSKRDGSGRVIGYRFSPPVMQGQAACVFKGVPMHLAEDAKKIQLIVDGCNKNKAKRLCPTKVNAISFRILIKCAVSLDDIDGKKLTHTLQAWAKYCHMNKCAQLIGRMMGNEQGDDREENVSLALFLIAKGDAHVEKLIHTLQILR